MSRIPSVFSLIVGTETHDFIPVLNSRDRSGYGSAFGHVLVRMTEVELRNYKRFAELTGGRLFFKKRNERILDDAPVVIELRP